MALSKRVERKISRALTENRSHAEAALYAMMRGTGGTDAGVNVTADSAMRQATVWACIDLVSSVGAGLPLEQFSTRDGTDYAEPLSAIFANPDPDPSMTAQAVRRQALVSAATVGNAYADVIGGMRDGMPEGLVMIAPSRVAWRYEKARSGHSWQVYVDNVRRTRWPLGDLWHFPLHVAAGSPVGMSPVEYHRQSIGSAQAAQKFGAQFFGDGGHPTFLIRPTENPGDAGARSLKEKILNATKGTREPAVIPQSVGIERLSIAPNDSQFIDTQRWGVEEIARVFLGGFVELIGGAVTGGSSMTYANREQLMTNFVALSLGPRYLIPLENALSTLAPRGHRVRHNVDALLRADLQARYQSYELAAKVADAMGAPLLTTNDMRRFEKLPPIDGGDTFVRRVSAAPKQEEMTSNA